MKLHIFTRCTRLENLKLITSSIDKAVSQVDYLDLTWHIIFDISYFKNIPSDILEDYSKVAQLHFKDNKGHGMRVFHDLISDLDVDYDSWMYILDDDNLMHPKFIKIIVDLEKSAKFDYKNFVVFDQYIGGKDWTGLEVRKVNINEIKVKEIDSAQFIFRLKSYDFYEEFGEGYLADGIFIEKAFKRDPEGFYYVPEILSFYNAVEKDPINNFPKIAVISDTPSPYLESDKVFDYEEDGLNVLRLVSDKESEWEKLVKFDPDCIVTISDSFEDFQNLCSLPLYLRKKWLHYNPGTEWGLIGKQAFHCANHNILGVPDKINSNLISVFTPVYNTGNKLYRTYQSLVNQTYTEWEWIILNDSTDEKRTQNILDDISSKDPRVKVFELDKKSGGNIGYAKYMSCCFTRGFLLVELDHDDELVESCLERLKMASEAYPECGFFYSDCTLAFDDLSTYTFPEGWGWGYGSFRKEVFREKEVYVMQSPRINPKTIRHIISAPNHVRAWKRDTYFKIGGHNRNLHMADDYELIVRTFLETKLCHIPDNLYIQYHYNNEDGINTTDTRRPDIQRRVRKVYEKYNIQIKKRFEELGLVDWAYRKNPSEFVNVGSKFNYEENFANVTFLSE